MVTAAEELESLTTDNMVNLVMIAREGGIAQVMSRDGSAEGKGLAAASI